MRVGVSDLLTNRVSVPYLSPMTTHSRKPRTPAQIAAQVAVEAVANDPMAYDVDTIDAVRQNGRRNGVSDFYLDMLEADVSAERLRQVPTRETAVKLGEALA